MSNVWWSGINRNILECKARILIPSRWSLRVLIETYWNVKWCSLWQATSTWNCINRNILECKEWQTAWVKTGMVSINRNILECKGGWSCLPQEFVFCINRNILECKEMTSQEFDISWSVLIETYWNVK